MWGARRRCSRDWGGCLRGDGRRPGWSCPAPPRAGPGWAFGSTEYRTAGIGPRGRGWRRHRWRPRRPERPGCRRAPRRRTAPNRRTSAAAPTVGSGSSRSGTRQTRSPAAGSLASSAPPASPRGRNSPGRWRASREWRSGGRAGRGRTSWKSPLRNGDGHSRTCLSVALWAVRTPALPFRFASTGRPATLPGNEGVAGDFHPV